MAELQDYHCQLPLSFLVEEFKVVNTRLVLTLRESKDQSVRKTGIETRTGMKWSASQAVKQAESRLRHKDIVGATCEGRRGLGSATHILWMDANQKLCRERGWHTWIFSSRSWVQRLPNSLFGQCSVPLVSLDETEKTLFKD